MVAVDAWAQHCQRLSMQSRRLVACASSATDDSQSREGRRQLRALGSEGCLLGCQRGAGEAFGLDELTAPKGDRGEVAVDHGGLDVVVAEELDECVPSSLEELSSLI